MTCVEAKIQNQHGRVVGFVKPHESDVNISRDFGILSSIYIYNMSFYRHIF